MKGKLGQILKLLVSLGIGIGLVWYIQRDLTAEDKRYILNGIEHANWFFVFLTVFLGAFACYLRAIRWRILLEPMGYNPPSSVLVCSIFIMYVANLIFPRLGEVLRCSILAKYSNVPIQKSVGTMVTERLIDVVGLGIIALFALIFEFDKILQFYHSLAGNPSEGSGNKGWILLGIVVFLALALFLLSKTKWFDKIKEMIGGFAEGVLSIRKIKNHNLFILYSIGIYGIYFLTTYLFFYAIQGMESLPLKSTFLVLTAGTLGVGLTQGGIGAYQLLITNALELYQIPKIVGLTYAWASWLFQTGLMVAGGLVSWVFLTFFYRGGGK